MKGRRKPTAQVSRAYEDFLFQHRMPLPLADGYRTVMLADAPIRRIERAIDLLQTILQFLAAILWAEHVSSGRRSPDVTGALTRLVQRDGAPLGLWLGFLRELALDEHGRAGLLCPELPAALVDDGLIETLGALLELRNSKRHPDGSPLALSKSAERSLLDELLERLRESYTALAFLSRYALCVIKPAHSGRRTTRAYYYPLRGPVASTSHTVRYSGQLPQETAMLFDPSCTAALVLHPFVVWAESDRDFTERVYVWCDVGRDGVVTVRHPRSGERREAQLEDAEDEPVDLGRWCGEGEELELKVPLSFRESDRALLCAVQESLARGDHIGSYEVIGKIGEGGMCEVYRARHRDLDRDVALKILKKEIALDPSLVKRFRLEGRTLARLDHPHVVRAFDASMDEGTGDLFLALEYLPGGDLERLIEVRGALPLQEALGVVLPILDALVYLHELPEPVIHRDVKPSNVIFDADGRPRLGDFGIVRVGTAESALTRCGGVPYTEMFAPPEQRDGTGEGVPGPTGDVYSAGALLLYSITGKGPPGVGRSVREIHPGLPRSLAEILDRALKAEPSRRFPSVRELRDRLRALKAGIPEGAETDIVVVDPAKVDFLRDLVARLEAANRAKMRAGPLTADQIERVYERTSCLFTQREMDYFSETEFASDTWIERLAPDRWRPDQADWTHLDHANDLIARELLGIDSEGPPRILEAGCGLLKTLDAILRHRASRSRGPVQYLGLDLSRPLMDRLEGLLGDGGWFSRRHEGRVAPLDLLADSSGGLVARANALEHLSRDSIRERLAGRLDAIVASYVLHHSTNGRRLARALAQGTFLEHVDAERRTWKSWGAPVLEDGARDAEARSHLVRHARALVKRSRGEAVESGLLDEAILAGLVRNRQLEAYEVFFELLRPGGALAIADPNGRSATFNRDEVRKNVELSIAQFSQPGEVIMDLQRTGFEVTNAWLQVRTTAGIRNVAQPPSALTRGERSFDELNAPILDEDLGYVIIATRGSRSGEVAEGEDSA